MGAIRKSEATIDLDEFFQKRGHFVTIKSGNKRSKKPSAPVGFEPVQPGTATASVSAPEPKPVAPAPRRQMTIKEIRQLFGDNGRPMSLDRFAEMIKTNRSNVWFWEKGKRPIPENFVLIIQNLVHKRLTEKGESVAPAAEETTAQA